MIKAAVQGMLKVTLEHRSDTDYFSDTISLLDRLSTAKVKIDTACRHNIDVVKATADILYAAQLYVDEATVPCTEWPTTRDVAEYLFAKYGHDL